VIKIDRNIRIPESRCFSANMSKYPWRTMQVGESFFIPLTRPSQRPNASRAGKTHGRVFVTRNVEGGIRIWRIA
jgi:hypothetical protein